jgi:hypothetical protein
MTVVPTGGMDWSPPLGSGATDLWGLAFFLALLVAVAAAVADDAGADDGSSHPTTRCSPAAHSTGNPPRCSNSTTPACG